MGLQSWSNLFMGIGIFGFLGVAGASGLLWRMSRARRRDRSGDGA
jgi:hypothetical protein